MPTLVRNRQGARLPSRGLERLMGTPDLERVRAVWRDLPDGDVVRGLRAAENYPPEVVRIIEAEVDTRGLDVETWPGEFEDRMIVGQVARRLRPVHRIVRRRPLVSAAIFSGLIVAGYMGMAFSGIVTSPVAAIVAFLAYVVAFWGGQAYISWSFRRYRPILKVVAVAWAIQFIAIAALGFWLAPQTGWRTMAPALLTNTVMMGVIPFGLLAGVTRLRNTYWPAHPEGCCGRCGYDLRGLPAPRCPECGCATRPEKGG